jgi:hypothetical protein
MPRPAPRVAPATRATLPASLMEPSGEGRLPGKELAAGIQNIYK